MTKLKRILIMAGGTGGHVFPGLAVAAYAKSQGVEVHWLGTSVGLEARLVPEAQIPLHEISIKGLRGKGIKPLLAAPFKISTAIMQARRIIKHVNPDVVIGMGGFASGPGGIASWMQKCPLIIHEQNAKAGFTNKQLFRFAKRVLEGFPGAFKAHAKVITVGNPVRAEIEHMQPPVVRFSPTLQKCRLLVLGGSLGAQVFNDMLPRALALIPEDARPEVWHQTGDKHFEGAKQSYETAQIKANLAPFIKDMAQAYSWADMVLCRAGALTVAELCSAGLGAVLIPFPHATDDHQTANAQFMVKLGGAVCVQQSALTPEQLADIVRDYASDPEKRFKMAEAAYKSRYTQVAEKIFKICQELLT